LRVATSADWVSSCTSTGKTLLTEVGPVRLEVPRDRASTFGPRLVAKGERRADGLDAMIISLYAGGMTVRDIQHHLARTLGTDLSHDTISKITDTVSEEVKALARECAPGMWVLGCGRLGPTTRAPVHRSTGQRRRAAGRAVNSHAAAFQLPDREPSRSSRALSNAARPHGPAREQPSVDARRKRQFTIEAQITETMIYMEPTDASALVT
jgi:hypothetical protein